MMQRSSRFATLPPNDYSLIGEPGTENTDFASFRRSTLFSTLKDVMTKIRLILLATTAISAAAFTQSPAFAGTAPIIVAQAAQPDQKDAPQAPPKAPSPPRKKKNRS